MNTRWCVLELATASQEKNQLIVWCPERPWKTRTVQGRDAVLCVCWVLPVCCLSVVKVYPTGRQPLLPFCDFQRVQAACAAGGASRIQPGRRAHIAVPPCQVTLYTGRDSSFCRSHGGSMSSGQGLGMGTRYY